MERRPPALPPDSSGAVPGIFRSVHISVFGLGAGSGLAKYGWGPVLLHKQNQHNWLLNASLQISIE